MSRSPAALIGWAIPVAAALLITAAPAAVAAEKPPRATTSDVIQYNANAKGDAYGPCAYVQTALGATAFQTTGGTDIFYSEVHYDTCNGGYVVRQGHTATGKVKIAKNLGRASATGRVPMSDGSTVVIDYDFVATGPVVLGGYWSGSVRVDLRTRPATVTPGTWTGVVSILESVVHPAVPATA